MTTGKYKTGKYKTREALKKAIWMRRHSDGKTLQKIAAEVGVSISTVRNVLFEMAAL